MQIKKKTLSKYRSINPDPIIISILNLNLFDLLWDLKPELQIIRESNLIFLLNHLIVSPEPHSIRYSSSSSPLSSPNRSQPSSPVTSNILYTYMILLSLLTSILTSNLIIQSSYARTDLS